MTPGFHEPEVLAIIAFAGTVVGSFFGCALYRLPRGQSLASPGSHCPTCGSSLGFRDLVPVLSWLFLRGQCRHCGAPIGLRYPLVELTTALSGAAVWFLWGSRWQDLWIIAVAWGLTYVLFRATARN